MLMLLFQNTCLSLYATHHMIIEIQETNAEFDVFFVFVSDLQDNSLFCIQMRIAISVLTLLHGILHPTSIVA